MLDERHLPLIDTDRRRLVRAATRLLGATDAEDAVQDAYVRALEGDASALSAAQAWLFTVVRNVAVDRLRRREWMQRWLASADLHAAVAEAPSAESEAALAEEADRALRRLAALLDPVDGAAVLLREVFELSHAELARAGGRSEAASRQQVRRALQRLRQRDRTDRLDHVSDDEEAARRDNADACREAAYRLYLHSLQVREPQLLFALLQQQRPSADVRVCAAASRAGAGRYRAGRIRGRARCSGSSRGRCRLRLTSPHPYPRSLLLP